MDHERLLDPSQPYKPIDFGNGLVAGSVAPDGSLLCLNTYHPVYGYASLSSFAPFPDDHRYDQGAVRAFRASLADPETPAFGLRPARPWESVRIFLEEDALPRSRMERGPLQAQVSTWTPLPGRRDSRFAIQEWKLANTSKLPIEWECAWSGDLYLARASMTQLTEGGIIPMPPTAIEATFNQGILTIYNPAIQLAAAISGLPQGRTFQESVPSGLAINLPWILSLSPDEEKQFRYVLAFGADPDEAQMNAIEALDRNLVAARQAVQRYWHNLWERRPMPGPASIERLAHRGLAYVLECCTLPVGAESICLLTDHQILPLSWTRDSYFMLRATLIFRTPGWLEIPRRHLIWLYETAQRPRGYWSRSYLPNGQPKDQAFQLDQQCYPLLEFAEYAELSGDEKTINRLLPVLPPVLEAIMARRAPHAGLYATEETPADDPLTLPYHFSSQVLLWHTLRSLIPIQARFGFTHLDLETLAEGLYREIWKHMVVVRQGVEMFAYAADLQGAFRFYQDANDLPTVLAPVWGFCSRNDPLWRATLEFAFSPENFEGYFPGPKGGLGSLHTPGAWPLGDIQELIYARLVGDTNREETVLDRLASTACWDGALPEARHPFSGDVLSRHWFAWPNCSLLVALSLDNVII